MENRININKQLEKSLLPDSIIVTNNNNEATYSSPTLNGSVICGDNILVKGSIQNITGDFTGWSEPEGVQWSNITLWDNRSWKVWFDVLETDGLGSTTTTPVTSTFSSFSDLIAELNNQLSTYGSSFRLVGSTTLNRILVTDLSQNILPAGDPYFSANSFTNMVLIIEDSITSSDWLVKGTNPKDFTLSNIPFYVNSGFSLKSLCISSTIQIPTPRFNFPTRNEVKNNNSSVNFVVNSCPINISYPEGYAEFESLVQAGKVRCQMQHLDGRARIVNYDINGTKIKSVSNSNKWRWCKHNNGTSDIGDYLFGGVEKDRKGNPYLDKIGMIMLNSTLKPYQEQSFNILPELWYGYGGAASQGVIAGMFPLSLDRWLNFPESTLKGENNKDSFINQGKPVLKNDRKYFRFCFMYKNGANRWVQGSFSEEFYIDTKLSTIIDNGAGTSQTYAVGFRLRRA